MGSSNDALIELLQSNAIALGDYITQRFAAQDLKIREQDKKIESHLADAQRKDTAQSQQATGVQGAIDGLQGQIDQLDGILDGVQKDCAHSTSGISALQANFQAQVARIGR
jgi:hypothetical protein